MAVTRTIVIPLVLFNIHLQIYFVSDNSDSTDTHLEVPLLISCLDQPMEVNLELGSILCFTILLTFIDLLSEPIFKLKMWSITLGLIV